MLKENILYKNIGVQTKGSTIGVVGSSGNIGHLLLDILDKYSQASLIKAFDVIPPKGAVSKRVTVYSGTDGDVTNLDAVHKFVENLDFIACAVGARRAKIFEIETGGIKNLVHASKETGRVQQLLYISVLGIPDKPLDFQITQKAKKEAEQHMIDSGIAYTVFRPSGYSFDFHRGLLPQLMQGYLTIVGNHDTKGQPIAAQNVAEVMAAAIGNQKAYNQIFNLGGKEVFSRSDFAKLYSRLLGKPIEVKNRTIEEFKEARARAGYPVSDEVILYMMKTESVLKPGDMEKLQHTFPGLDDLFINYETRARELLNEQAPK